MPESRPEKRGPNVPAHPDQGLYEFLLAHRDVIITALVIAVVVMVGLAGLRYLHGKREGAAASELIDLLCESLKEGETPSDALEQLQARWAEEAQTCSGPAQDTESLDENELLNLEDGEMSDIESGDAQQLLQQAQVGLAVAHQPFQSGFAIDVGKMGK